MGTNEIMSVEQIFNFLQQGGEDQDRNPFDTDESSKAIDAALSRLIPKDNDATVDLLGLIVDERKRAFKIGFKVARSLLVGQ